MNDDAVESLINTKYTEYMQCSTVKDLKRKFYYDMLKADSRQEKTILERAYSRCYKELFRQEMWPNDK